MVSLLVLVCMMAFSIYRSIIFISKDDPEVSKQEFMRNLDHENAVNPRKYGFDIAFGLDKQLDPTFGYVTVN